MNIFYRLTLVLALALFALTGCSEERKREAARLAAQMEANEKGDTLATSSGSLSDASGVEAEQLSQTTDTIPSADTTAVDSQATSDTGASQQQQNQPTDSVSQREVPSRPSGAMPPAITEGFTVQVESSPLRSYIESQVELFKQRGYDAYIGAVTRPDDQKTYYRLRIGQYATMQEAAAVSTEINQTFGLQSWVDKATFGSSTPSGEQPR